VATNDPTTGVPPMSHGANGKLKYHEGRKCHHVNYPGQKHLGLSLTQLLWHKIRAVVETIGWLTTAHRRQESAGMPYRQHFTRQRI